MISKFRIPLSKLIEEFNLETLCLSVDPADILLKSTEINRPGLQLAGFYEIFDNNRIQILGITEMTYLGELKREVAEERLDKLFMLAPPVVIVTSGLEVPDLLKDMADRHNIPLLRTSEATCDFMAEIISKLSVDLAPRITRHGVLVEVFGDGVLILGESGIGKSETAVELIARGHRIVADDAVEVRRVSGRSLVGSSPQNIRHFMELRGLGVINVQQLFGIRAVKITEKISLIVKLEQWDETKAYDRMGIENEFIEVLGIKVPSATIPVKPGRNLSVIIEAAVMNLRLKKMGYSAPHELLKSLGMSTSDIPPVERIERSSYWDAVEY